MIKESANQEDTIVNMHVSNIIATKYIKQILTELKSNIIIVTVGNLNIQL